MREKIKENKYVLWGLTLFSVIGASITLYFLLLRFDKIWFGISELLKTLSPIFLGILFAYLLNPAVKFFETKACQKLIKKLYKNKELKHKKIPRMLAMFLTYIIALTLIFLFIKFVIPSLLESIQLMITNIPTYIDNIYEFLKGIIKSNTNLEKIIDSLNTNITSYFTNILSPAFDKIMTNITIGITSFISGIINIVIAIIVSIYLLFDKESFIRNTNKVFKAFMPEKIYSEFKTILKYTDKIFGNFMIAKIIDASIVGVLTFIFSSIFKIPYALIISVIVAVTNVIPYFGPFIGAVPSALLLLMIDPAKCFTFIIIIFLIQQFDGNVLEPKIIGNKTGIKSFWVLFSILLFGELFGFIGMIFGVPIFAIIYSIFKNAVDKKLAKKNS